jgi:hypothetical protein
MANSSFFESIRHAMRTKHYSIQTEKTYVFWIKIFILFNQKRHPKDLGQQEGRRNSHFNYPNPKVIDACCVD